MFLALIKFVYANASDIIERIYSVCFQDSEGYDMIGFVIASSDEVGTDISINVLVKYIRHIRSPVIVLYLYFHT